VSFDQMKGVECRALAECDVMVMECAIIGFRMMDVIFAWICSVCALIEGMVRLTRSRLRL